MKLFWLFVVSKAGAIESEKNDEDNLIDLVTPFAPPSKSVTVTENDEPEKKEPCILDKDGKPPRPRMILLGETGVGKSTLGNRLFQGYSEESDESNDNREDGVSEDILVMPDSYLQKTKSMEFGIGHMMVSHTNETVWKTGRWLGSHSNECVTIIDTQGMQDTQNRSCVFTRNIGNVVRSLGQIDVFMLLFKGETTRLTPVVREQLNTFQQLFGRNFWKRCIIQITFFSHDKRSRRRRREGRNVETIKKSWDKMLKEELFVPYDVPVVFIDSVIPDGDADDYEVEMFKNETRKVHQFMSMDAPYECLDSSCANHEFTEGIPIYMDIEMGNHNRVLAREHSSAILKFQIWFAEDCRSYDNLRNYEILKNNETIFTMVEEKRKGRRFRKVGKPTSLFPTNMVIEDECGEITTDMQCDYEKSKWKYVIIKFNNIHPDNYGEYQIKNIIGFSDKVELVETVDGGWSEWTEWTTCSKACFNRDMEHGVHSRERSCDKPSPKNNGNTCLGKNKEVSSCAPKKMCVGSWESWSPWSSCSKSCGKGSRSRQRTCSNAGCTEFKDLGYNIETLANGAVQMDNSCNPQACPRNTIIGEWTSWKCNKECFNNWNDYNGRNSKFLRSRSRSCKEHSYFNGTHSVKHPDPNHHCENIIQSQSERECQHLNIHFCPSLGQLIIQVGPDSSDGTDDWVQIKFENANGETCKTNYLNGKREYSLYEAGSVVKWTEKLGTCTNFRPDDQLKVEIIIWRKGWNSWWNGYKFGKIQAIFAYDPIKMGLGSSVWTTIKETDFCDGCDSKWYPMTNNRG